MQVDKAIRENNSTLERIYFVLFVARLPLRNIFSEELVPHIYWFIYFIFFNLKFDISMSIMQEKKVARKPNREGK